MSYVVSLTPEAEEDLRRLKDPVLQSHVLDELEHLAKSPVALSRRAGFPHLMYQKYQFWSPDHTIHFTALFQYGQDARTLFILGIGVVRY